jgi:hypothetical protein
VAVIPLGPHTPTGIDTRKRCSAESCMPHDREDTERGSAHVLACVPRLTRLTAGINSGSVNTTDG